MASVNPTIRTLKSTFLFISLLISSHLPISDSHGGSGAGETHADEDLHAKGLIPVKIWCLVILLISTFAGGISPYFLRWNESFLLLGTQFAGGVFLGTSLMHFLSDSTATFGDLTEKTYPFSFMLASAGYLLTMFGDCVVFSVTSSVRRKEEEEGSAAGEESGKEMEVSGENPGYWKTSSVGDTILLIVALCFHSVFEGIAIGITATKADAWKNLWTISLHKIFAAIAMGIALLKMLPKRPFLITTAYSFAFAVSSPIGVGIGIAIDAATEGLAANWTYAVAMALAAGIFIYVAINHLIAKGFRPSADCYFDRPQFKFLAVFFGIGVIGVVMIWDA